jgi:hypothetical protein
MCILRAAGNRQIYQPLNYFYMKINFKLLNGLAGCLGATLVTLIACNNGPVKPDARTCSAGPDIPHMWVGDSTSDTDESHFLGYIPIINGQLGANMHETDSIYYTTAEFKAMIDSIKKIGGIEFVDICPVVNPATNRLTVLYQAEDGGCNPKAWFTLPENGATFPEPGDVLASGDFTTWQNLYINTVVKWLNPQLDKMDPANFVGSAMGTQLLNTLHASHNFSDLTELYDEMTRQSGNGISGIEAIFAAKATQSVHKDYGFSNRLYVMLEFTKDDSSGKHKRFRIDTCGRKYVGPDWPAIDACGLAPKLLDSLKIIRSKLLGGSDNGQLCPPTCNP